ALTCARSGRAAATGRAACCASAESAAPSGGTAANAASASKTAAPAETWTARIAAASHRSLARRTARAESAAERLTEFIVGIFPAHARKIRLNARLKGRIGSALSLGAKNRISPVLFLRCVIEGLAQRR